MKKLLTIFAVAAMVALTACGGRQAGKSNNAASEEPEKVTQEDVTLAEEDTPAPVAEKAEEPKVEAPKWYEQDFCLTEKMFVLGNPFTRTYARKGNILAYKTEGSQTQNLLVCTDSSRTNYLIGNNGKYAKLSEKKGFSGIEEAVRSYLKDQMSNTLFDKIPKKDDKGCTVKDTTIFGRPAYILTKETTETILTNEVYTKVILHIDKENGLPYYKYGLGKTNGQVLIDGVSFEVTDFSAEPTYEGLIMSLDGLTEAQ